MGTKCVDRCLAKQAAIRSSGDYRAKACAACGTEFYVNNYAKSEHCCRCREAVSQARNEARARNRLSPLEGFPRDPFTSREEMEEYINGDGVSKIQCLVCGRWFGKLGIHIKQHGLSINEYKAKFAIPFHGHGLAGQHAKERASLLGRKQAAKLTMEDKRALQKKMMEAVRRKGGITKNITPYYHEELKANSIKAATALHEILDGKLSAVPCSRCGTEIVASLNAAISSACRILCSGCKDDAEREKRERFYAKLRQDPARYARYLERMRTGNAEARRRKKAAAMGEVQP